MSGTRFRLVAVDLDGTLLDSSRRIPGENRDALRRAHEAGVIIAVVSGRRFPALKPYLEELGFPLLVVANSGAIVKDGIDGVILRRRLLDSGVARRILDLAARIGIEPVLHDGPDAEGHLILRKAARALPSYRRYLNASSPPPRWVERIELRRDPVQVGFASGVEPIRELEKHLASELGPEDALWARTEYVNEDFALLDVVSPEASKSRGLAFLRSHLSIELARTLAIGDNWNDLDMLEHAGLGVLMANAARELRARGFAITESNDEAGVAKAIRRYVLK